MQKNELVPARANGAPTRFEDQLFTPLFGRMNRIFDEVFGTWPAFEAHPVHRLAPRLDVRETDTALEVSAELPGLGQEDVELLLTDDVLTLRGEKKSTREGTEGSFHLMERTYGRFERSIRLPCPVQADAVEATFSKGILTVTLPKSPEAATRRIEVKSG